MNARNRTGKLALLLGTALALAPQAATSAQLTHMETESLTVGMKVFQPDAVAFSANGVTVRCSQIAFSIAQSLPHCFAALTEEDVAAIREMARLGRAFTTPSGLTFSPSPDGTGVVALGERGRSFPVAGNPGSVGSSGGGMTEDEVAAFLGLGSAAELGDAAGGIVVTGTTGTTGTAVSVDGSAGTGGDQVSISADGLVGGGNGISASVDGDAAIGGGSKGGGISAGVDADASAGGGGGLSAGIDADASAGGGKGISAGLDADASAGGGGISAGVDADASAGGGSKGGGISAGVDADASAGSGGISAGIDASADVGGVSADVGASAGVGSDPGALR